MTFTENGKKKDSKEKDEIHLKRHQKEMERLIRNLSMSINVRSGVKITRPSATRSTSIKGNDLSKILPIQLLEKGKKQNSDEVDRDTDANLKQGMDARWQPVEGIKNHKFFVYSAYYDTRDNKNPVVRVVGVTRTKRSDKVMCRMYFNKTENGIQNSKNGKHSSDKLTYNISSSNKNSHQSFFDVPASISIIRENWNLKYSACFVICPLKAHTTSSNSKEKLVPDSISILPITSSDLKVTNRLPVINSQNGGTGTYQVNKTDVGVCVKPIHFYYNKTLELIEFIELNKLLGVTKFTFYNHTMSDEVQCVLEYYKNEEDLVSVMSWDLKVDSQTEIRTEGLFAALNDCLYRNMNDFHYLMLIDFDEFVIPHMNDSIPDMLEYLNSNSVVTKNGRKLAHPKLTSSYSFQNAFFYLQFGMFYMIIYTHLNFISYFFLGKLTKSI